MLLNAYFLAKIGADTAENERNFAENLKKNWQLPYGSHGSPLPYGVGRGLRLRRVRARGRGLRGRERRLELRHPRLEDATVAAPDFRRI